MENLGLGILCIWSMGGMFLLYKLNCKLIKEEKRTEYKDYKEKNEEA